jgi:hypothetical protein
MQKPMPLRLILNLIRRLLAERIPFLLACQMDLVKSPVYPGNIIITVEVQSKSSLFGFRPAISKNKFTQMLFIY